ncbi:sigma-70 family RNA polymerase sigma factor [bacterium]|nr:sigma-70 family RNA polymerase sigma factor [bacterium]
MALFQIFSKKELTDEELIARFKETKDSKWVGMLYQRYTHICLAVCIKYLKNEEEAKDAVMQVFEKLLSDLLKHEVQFFQGWLHTYLKNHCLMMLRKAKPVSSYNDEIKLKETNDAFVENSNGEHLSDKEILELNIEQLEQALAQLKSEQRECIRMFYIEEKSYKEIEQLTGFDYKQVKSYLQNGKRNLKLIMSKNA